MLRVSPAIEAGLAGHIWSLDESAGFLDNVLFEASDAQEN
jgi:hypothetical protein